MPVVVLFEKLLAQVERSTKSHEVEQFWVMRGSFFSQERKPETKSGLQDLFHSHIVGGEVA